MTVANSFREQEEQEEDLEDWELIGSDWWQQSYVDVDWACVRRYHWTETGVKLTFHPRPPHYHSALYSEKEKYELTGEQQLDVELDPSLVGAKGAEYALEHYERRVGICNSLSDIMFTAELLLPEDASEDIIRRGREQWERHVDALLGGILEPSCLDLPPRLPDERVRMWNLDAIDDSCYDSDSHSPDVVDLTYSDISFESEPPPTTPQGDKKSYAEVLFDDRGTPTHTGTVISPSPSKPLNASALAFIPAYVLDHASPSPSSPDVPYVSPTYEFHFPSLNSNLASRTSTRSLPPPLQRDEHGFYNEVPSTSTHSASQSRSATPKLAAEAAVPAFLGQDNVPRQSSKTREMVDRLRSSGSGSRRSRKHKGEAKVQPQKDPDGWFTGADASEHRRSKSSNSGEDWVQGLFQCRQPEKPAQQPPRQMHKRSTSAGTNASAHTTTPTTPSSTASTLSTLPSPTGSTFSNPCTPTNTQFPLPQFYAFQPPYGPYPAAYPIPPQGPPMQVMQAPWQLHAPLVSAHPAYVLPPMYGTAPFDARKAAPVGGARHA
ncbi:uncharacterized protein PHACADRAFT_260036 [Phanerochaete carnosa HHB-10118-sp]|uniref:Uncharacterized protein n=1 Tax=Phanerochaete carnosa (strain HHB-10118-sp) TaxID=650164 RepID=K5W381_PHACS|nr:uncharacterized protein PHACADRAFT_260036 [Phanerochaete carnosa HHB-10118-sp]EKM53600.1 hypothetical protein PHACADRAFT_260036 [Phanerochaete carnosa HHB-10118-sp]